MYYVIQENMLREYGFKALTEHLERNDLEYEIVPFRPFTNEINVKTSRKDVFLFGSTNFGNVAKHYGWSPGHFINEYFNFEVYLAQYGKELLNSDAKIVMIGGDNNLPKEFFARPSEDSKQFPSKVYTDIEWKHWIKDLNDSNLLQSVSGDTKALICAPKDGIIQEIRCWIVDKEPVTISQYKIGGRANFLNMDNNEEAILYARKMARKFSPARAYCMDICLYMEDGESEYRIVELGCINHCGFYDANMSKLIQALENAYPF